MNFWPAKPALGKKKSDYRFLQGIGRKHSTEIVAK
jgi:hypothetical protein